jgi:8-oxo-dGTP pyrophosphatase MutT (NUDIX family)
MSVFESLIKECMEEASIEADVIKNHTRAVGSISYFFRYEGVLSIIYA